MSNYNNNILDVVTVREEWLWRKMWKFCPQSGYGEKCALSVCACLKYKLIFQKKKFSRFVAIKIGCF